MTSSHSTAQTVADLVIDQRGAEHLDSDRCQPVTTLSANRPPVMWSMVVACLAAMIGWIVSTCAVENTPNCW